MVQYLLPYPKPKFGNCSLKGVKYFEVEGKRAMVVDRPKKP